MGYFEKQKLKSNTFQLKKYTDKMKHRRKSKTQTNKEKRKVTQLLPALILGPFFHKLCHLLYCYFDVKYHTHLIQ